LGGSYPADDRPTVHPLGKPAHSLPLSRRGSVIAVLLLSLGLWAAIWAAVTSLASGLLG